MSDETAWLRGVVESAGGGAEREEWRHGDLGAYAEAAPAWRFDLTDGPWLTVDEAREAAALHNLAPELLACIEAAEGVQTGWGDADDAWSKLDAALDALRAKVRAQMEASREG